MITRIILSIIFGGLAFMIQVSFIAALPFPLSAGLLVVYAGAYFTQHLGVQDGIVWIVAAGIVSDAFGLAPPGYGTVAALCTGAWLFFASTRIFSHRSLYGIVSCVITTTLVFQLAAALVLVVFLLLGREIDWQGQANLALWGMLFSLPMAIILFKVCSPFRPILERVGFRSERL